MSNGAIDRPSCSEEILKIKILKKSWGIMFETNFLEQDIIWDFCMFASLVLI